MLSTPASCRVVRAPREDEGVRVQRNADEYGGIRLTPCPLERQSGDVNTHVRMSSSTSREAGWRVGKEARAGVEDAVRDAVAPVPAHVADRARVRAERRCRAVADRKELRDLMHRVAVIGVERVEVAALDPVAKGGQRVGHQVPVAQPPVHRRVASARRHRLALDHWLDEPLRRDRLGNRLSSEAQACTKT